MKHLGKLLAIGSVLLAVNTFNPHSFNSWIISVLLMLSAALLVLPERIKKFIRALAVATAALLILKLLFFG